MAVDNDALFTAARGFIFIGAVGATAPTASEIASFTQASGLGAGWENIGHTSADELPEPGFDGGDAETKGSWQNSALKEVTTEATVDYMTFNVHQWSDMCLELYYGQANMNTAEPGEFRVEDASTSSSERALCMVIVDGDAKVAFYANKASIRREGPVALAVDEFSALPLRATFLKNGANDLFRWISSDLGINPDES